MMKGVDSTIRFIPRKGGQHQTYWKLQPLWPSTTRLCLMQAQENTWVVHFVHGKSSWHFWIFLHDFRNEWYVHVRKGSWFVYLFNAEGLCLFPSQTFVAIDHLCLHFLHICTHPGAIRPHDFPQRLCQDFHLFGAEISPRFLACSSVSLNAKGFNSCHENCRSRQVKGRAESHFRKNDILMAPQWTNLLNLWIYFQQRNFFRLSL